MTNNSQLIFQNYDDELEIQLAEIKNVQLRGKGETLFEYLTLTSNKSLTDVETKK